MTLRRRVICSLLLVSLSGCASIEERVAALNDRQVSSCVYVLAFPYPFAAWRSITATGGVSLETCHQLK